MIDITLLHPIIVHFTIALFSVAVVLDILAYFTKKESFHTAAWINLIVAGSAAIFTVISGLLAEANVPHNDAAHEIMETHETLGFFVLGAILILLTWRIFLKGRFPAKGALWYVAIGVTGLVLMFTGAYYGGEMVYVHGVAVKAVPISHDEAGHHHSSEAESPSGVKKSGTHVHKDSSVHEH